VGIFQEALNNLILVIPAKAGIQENQNLDISCSLSQRRLGAGVTDQVP
jgi:hypothetical protein